MSDHLCIFEDGAFADLYPLSLSQPIFDLRIGASSLGARWRIAFPNATVSFLCRDYLADVVRTAGADVNPAVAGDVVFVNARWLCFGGEADGALKALPANAVLTHRGVVLAARISGDGARDFATQLRSSLSEVAVDAQCARFAARLLGGGEPNGSTGELAEFIDARKWRRVELDDARLISFVWNLIEHNAACIADDAARARPAPRHADTSHHDTAHLVNPNHIFLGANAVIRAGVVIDATDGPVIVGERAVVMPNATVVGPVAIGADSVVKAGARVLGGTSIGRVCKVGGEVDETIFGDYSNKQHDGFLGHSYIGSWVNIGAASNNSDLKNTYGPIRMWSAGQSRDTGRQFLGLVMGDHTKTGINSVFNTGTVVGFNCNLYSSEMTDGFVPSFSWGHGRDFVPYDLGKAMLTATAAMKRRGMVFGEAHRRLFERIHDIATRSNRNA